MKIQSLLPLACLCMATALSAEPMPAGAIETGTLSNEKLLSDTLPQAIILAGGKGCQNPQHFQPYIKAQPTGKAGSRVWQEIWLIQCQNGNYPIEIRFQEDATGVSFQLR